MSSDRPPFPVAPPVLARGIVSRPRLVGRLGASARVTVVSAPPDSGRTVLLRFRINQVGRSELRRVGASQAR